MSFPFRRRGSSPRSPGYTNGYASHNMWKTTRRRIIDARKLIQIVGIFVLVTVLLSLLLGFWGDSDEYNDPFKVERSPTTNFFTDFEGGLECKLTSQELYLPPIIDDPKEAKAWPYCATREKQLPAMSGGGRYGFDTPYTPHGCHYKWYTPLEICMILERFDGVAFIGDDLIQGIYGAFNMFIRQNIALGTLEQWRMDKRSLEECRCRRQYTNPECVKYFVQSSDEVVKHDSEGEPRSPYKCSRVPHFYYSISGPAHPDLTSRFRDFLDQDPHSWKPVGIIHSLGLSTGFSWQTATESMDEWLTIADASGRNTPFLWMGPNAAGHLKPPSRIMQEGNNALWHYSLMMANEAKRRGVEALNSYNLTLQASSWDGSNYDERVALVQAMMVINWLAKVETT